MHKYIGLMLIVALCFTLIGCSPDSEEKNNSVSNVSSIPTYFDGESSVVLEKGPIVSQIQAGTLTIEYHTLDEIPTKTDVKLTMSSDELKETINDTELPRTEPGDGKYIRYSCGGGDFYFTNDENDNGLAAIVCYGTAYGFQPTVTTKDDILYVLGDPNVNAPATDEARSLLLHQETGCTYMDYTFGNNHVSFFFRDNGKLNLTVIYQNGLWIY